MRTLRDKLIKIGAKVVSHSRYVIFQMAEVAVPQTLFREILDRIRQLRFLTIPARPG
ncbi:MAG: transposase [Phycisphaerae bacterium]|nr:transposase [Phycisphaerae bacterium]